MFIITSVLILIMAVILVIVRKQSITNKQLHNEIETNSAAVQELETFTYHDQDEIKDWIEDGVRDIQYDIDEHSTTIENLNCDKADEYSLDNLKTKIAEDAEDIGSLINAGNKRLNNVIEYLLAHSPQFKDIEDKTNDEEYDNFLKSFDDTSIWTDGRRSEHHKVLATLLDEGNYNASHEDMGDEIYYKVYNILIGKGDKDELVANKG